MFKSELYLKTFFFLAISFVFFSSCSPKIKIGVWVKNYKEAASALEAWGASNPEDALTLFNLDCTDRKQFKQKISDALNHPLPTQRDTSSFDRRDPRSFVRIGPDYEFNYWCHKYPKAAKSLRRHAKALCKAGTGILENYKMK